MYRVYVKVAAEVIALGDTWMTAEKAIEAAESALKKGLTIEIRNRRGEVIFFDRFEGDEECQRDLAERSVSENLSSNWRGQLFTMTKIGDFPRNSDMGWSGRFYSTRPFDMIDPEDAFWPFPVACGAAFP
jgi:hypothetical protein